MNLYTMMSLGLAASVAGVSVFGPERMTTGTYFREAQAGHNRLAYHLGTTFAAWYRILVGVLVFTGVYQFIGGNTVDSGVVYGVLLLAYWCYYGLAAIVSFVASTRNASLIASLGAICVGVFSGFMPFPKGLKVLAFPFWVSQIFMERQHASTAHWGTENLSEWGYESGMEAPAFVVLSAMAVAIHATGFAVMTIAHRDRQR